METPRNINETAEQDERRVVTDTNVWDDGFIRNEEAYISSICDSVNDESFIYPGEHREEEKSISYYVFYQQYSTLPTGMLAKPFSSAVLHSPSRQSTTRPTQRTCSSRTTRIRGTLS